MLREIVDAAGLEREPTRGAVVRCILESIASGVAGVVDELSVITGTEMRRVCVVGGSSRVRLLNELIAFHTKLPVVVGSSEATALGNAVAQGLGIGYFAGLDEARGWLKATGTVLEPM
jgi:rhamnulokinase